VRNIFDTRVAAQLLGVRAFGLAALLEKYFGVKLDKKHQRADWSMRPLTADMLEYAAQDTMHLLELRDRPVDYKPLRAAAAETEVTVRSAVRRPGVEALNKALAPHGLAGRVRLLALPDAFLPQGKASDILKEHGLDAAGIAKAVYEAVRGRVEERTES